MSDKALTNLSDNIAPVGRTRRASSARARSALKAKGIRRRAAIKSATREVLNEKGFRQTRLQDVAGRAGVSPSVLYHYFRDLRGVVAELAQDLFEELSDAAVGGQDLQEPYDWILATLQNAVHHLGGNPGILGCLFGLAGDYQEFDEIWTKNAHAWNLRVADFLVEHAAFSESAASNMAFALGAMTEGFLYQVYIRHTNDLESFSGSSNSIAELIATLWYRTIFLKNPPERSASRVARRISQSEDN